MGLISNGTTIFDAGSLASGLASSLTFIKKITASSSATVDFVDGSSGVVLDSQAKKEFNENYIKAKSLLELFK